MDPAGNMIAAASGVPKINVFECESSAAVLSQGYSLALPHPEKATAVPQTIRFGDDGRLYAGDTHGRIVAWNTENRKLEFVLDKFRTGPSGSELDSLPIAFRRHVAGIVARPESRTLFSAGSDTYVKQWDVLPPITTLKLPPKAHIAFDPQAPWLLWVGAGRCLQLVDSRDGRNLASHARLADGDRLA